MATKAKEGGRRMALAVVLFYREKIVLSGNLKGGF
jgi:hypothetical protein